MLGVAVILVTAATAPVGRSLVEQLVASGTPVRALTRDTESTGLPAGAGIVAGDLADPASLAAALEGVTAVFLLAVVPGFEDGFLKAAREAGVRRIVFQSSGAIDDPDGPNPIGAFHTGVEEAVRASGMEWTFLRLAVASADALQWAFDVPSQLAEGDTVRGPYAKAAGSPVHPADFAAVALAALTRPEHAGRIYDVTGPVSLTHAEQIRLIGEAAGRPLRYEELTPEQAREKISPYAPADVLFATWRRHLTTPAPVTETIQRLTGRAARTAAEWAAHHAAGL